MKTYGTPDADTSAYDTLMKAVEGKFLQYIMHYPRVAIDARPCQLPTSHKVIAVLSSGRTITAFQAKPNGKVKLSET